MHGIPVGRSLSTVLPVAVVVPVVAVPVARAVVAALDENEMIPKPQLRKHLQGEAPYFTATLLDCQLPPVIGRLRVPIVETDDKRSLAENNRSPVEQFIADHCEKCKEGKLLVAEILKAHPELETKKVLAQLRSANLEAKRSTGNQWIVEGWTLKEAEVQASTAVVSLALTMGSSNSAVPAH